MRVLYPKISPCGNLNPNRLKSEVSYTRNDWWWCAVHNQQGYLHLEVSKSLSKEEAEEKLKAMAAKVTEAVPEIKYEDEIVSGSYKTTYID